MNEQRPWPHNSHITLNGIAIYRETELQCSSFTAACIVPPMTQYSAVLKLLQQRRGERPCKHCSSKRRLSQFCRCFEPQVVITMLTERTDDTVGVVSLIGNFAVCCIRIELTAQPTDTVNAACERNNRRVCSFICGQIPDDTFRIYDVKKEEVCT